MMQRAARGMECSKRLDGKLRGRRVAGIAEVGSGCHKDASVRPLGGLTARRFACTVSPMESQSAPVAGKQVRGTPTMACCWFWFSFTSYQPPGGAGGA